MKKLMALALSLIFVFSMTALAYKGKPIYPN